MRIGNLQISRHNKTFGDIKDIPVTNLDRQYTTPGLIARSSYDNGFAPVSAIVDELLKRNLRLGDRNNPDTDVTARFAFWNSFARPNDRMGYIQFLDVLVSGFLTLEEFSLLVWGYDGKTVEPGQPSKGWTLDNIAGYTIVSNDLKQLDSQGREEWTIDFGSQGGTRKFYREDIISLRYSVLPDDGITGVSPGSASAQEAAIRDRLNQQQRALFDNGATPSLIVTIYARSHDEYTAIQQAYEQRNRGASKAGGVVYQSVIDKGMLQGMAEPRIEITTVGTSNNNLALKEIVEFTEKTITANYGVSPIIYGDATTTTFQNQNLADKKFMDRVQAVMVRLFGCFENELSRLIGLELPFTFVWDDVTLDIVEEQQLRAQTKTEQVRAFVGLVQSGATPAQAQLMLELPDEWAQLDIVAPETQPDLIPEQPTLNIKPLQLQACSCEHNELPSHGKPTKSEQKIVKLLKEYTESIYNKKVSNATTAQIDKQIIEELTSVMREGADSVGLLSDDDMARVLADFGALSEKSIARMEKRAKLVTQNYTDYVTNKITSLPDDDPAKKLFTDFYKNYADKKAHVIAGQEVKSAYQNGELDMASNIDSWLKKNKKQSYVVKTWQTTSAKPCQFCESMNGTEAGIRDSFVPGGLIETDDTVLALDDTYSDGTIPDAHTNCRCKFTFKLISK